VWEGDPKSVVPINKTCRCEHSAASMEERVICATTAMTECVCACVIVEGYEDARAVGSV